MATGVPGKSDPSKKRPSVRRQGREAALQFLFSHDQNPDVGLQDPEFEQFWNLRHAKPKVRDFATDLLRGLVPRLAEIDERISDATDHYALDRLATVDRCLLRLAVFEILYRDDIPTPVSINEAVEISKDFGTEESPRFVNGVLDRVSKDPGTGEAPTSIP